MNLGKQRRVPRHFFELCVFDATVGGLPDNGAFRMRSIRLAVAIKRAPLADLSFLSSSAISQACDPLFTASSTAELNITGVENAYRVALKIPRAKDLSDQQKLQEGVYWMLGRIPREFNKRKPAWLSPKFCRKIAKTLGVSPVWLESGQQYPMWLEEPVRLYRESAAWAQRIHEGAEEAGDLSRYFT